MLLIFNCFILFICKYFAVSAAISYMVKDLSKNFDFIRSYLRRLSNPAGFIVCLFVLLCWLVLIDWLSFLPSCMVNKVEYIKFCVNCSVVLRRYTWRRNTVRRQWSRRYWSDVTASTSRVGTHWRLYTSPRSTTANKSSLCFSATMPAHNDTPRFTLIHDLLFLPIIHSFIHSFIYWYAVAAVQVIQT